MPVTDRLRAAPDVFRLALTLRLGVPVPELCGGVWPCGGCGSGVLDVWGRHPCCCKSGNRLSLWTDRHDSVQRMLQWVFRRAGVMTHEVGWRRSFGAAGFTDTGGYLRADLYCPGYRAVGRDLFMDVAVADPGCATALAASPSSADVVGRAAQLRADTKRRKYGAAALAVGGEFRAAVIERFGACSDDMLGLLRMISGDADRDLRGADDYYFTAPSRKSYYEQHVVFAAVMADAVMLQTVIGVDVGCVGGDGAGGAGAGGAGDGAGGAGPGGRGIGG